MTVAMPFVEIKQPHKINWMYYGQHGPASLFEKGSVSSQHLFYIYIQSCKMSNILHGAKPSNQILPEEKRVNRDNVRTKIKQN